MADLLPFALAWLAYWFMVGALYEARVYRRALARRQQKPKPVGPYRTAADGLPKMPPHPEVEPVPPPPRPVRPAMPKMPRMPSLGDLPPLPHLPKLAMDMNQWRANLEDWKLRVAAWHGDMSKHVGFTTTTTTTTRTTPQEIDETVYGSGTKDRPQ